MFSISSVMRMRLGARVLHAYSTDSLRRSVIPTLEDISSRTVSESNPHSLILRMDSMRVLSISSKTIEFSSPSVIPDGFSIRESTSYPMASPYADLSEGMSPFSSLIRE